MDDCKQSFAKMRDYRIAAGLFESAFEACKRLSSEDRQSLLTKIEKQCSRHPPTAQPKQYKTVEIKVSRSSSHLDEVAADWRDLRIASTAKGVECLLK